MVAPPHRPAATIRTRRRVRVAGLTLVVRGGLVIHWAGSSDQAWRSSVHGSASSVGLISAGSCSGVVEFMVCGPFLLVAQGVYGAKRRGPVGGVPAEEDPGEHGDGQGADDGGPTDDRL